MIILFSSIVCSGKLAKTVGLKFAIEYLAHKDLQLSKL